MNAKSVPAGRLALLLGKIRDFRRRRPSDWAAAAVTRQLLPAA
jgi:hypothetical protein